MTLKSPRWMARAAVAATIAAVIVLPLLAASACTRPESDQASAEPQDDQHSAEPQDDPSRAEPRDEQIRAIFPKPVPSRATRQAAVAPFPNAALTCPVFPGDSFNLYVAPEKSEGQVPMGIVFEEVVGPTLEVLGFGRPEQISPPSNLTGSPGVLRPGPDYSRLLGQICARSEKERTSEERAVCATFLDPERYPPTPEVDRTLEETFGVTFDEMMGARPSGRIDYVFTQRVFSGDPNCESSPAGGVPIEHTLITASRNPGETVSSVKGTYFDAYQCQNGIARPVDWAIRRAYENLWRLPGIGRTEGDEPLELTPPDGVELVLLPSGAAPSPSGQVPALYYSYRMLLFADLESPRRMRVSWRAWVDASNGELLQLIPQFAEASVKANGRIWNMQAGADSATSPFAVDPAVNGFFTLELDDCDGASDSGTIADYSCVMSRLDRCRKCTTGEACDCESQGSFDDDEVAIAVGADPELADFDTDGIGGGETCLTADPANRFGQVNAFYHLSRFHEQVVSAGSIPLPFPETPLQVLIDKPPADDGLGVVDSQPSSNYDVAPQLEFPVGRGAIHPKCTEGGAELANLNLNAAHDASLLMHEFGHIVTKRFRERRDPCDSPDACPEPWASRLLFHDFADAWAADYTEDNCIAGWYARHRNGEDVSFGCAQHVEGTGLPRLLDPNVDIFPTSRSNADTDGYRDGQIAGAGLWAVREGLRRSRLGVGPTLWRIKLNAALFDYETGIQQCSQADPSDSTSSNPVACDKDIYRYLRSLAFELAEEWKTNEHGLINQVLGGWAKIGIFLTPWECIDMSPNTGDCWFCDNRDTGADAVIDVGDQWKGPQALAADTLMRLATQPDIGTGTSGSERLPYFHVWTGPPFVFEADGHAETDHDQCNSEYEIELSPNDQFPQQATFKHEGHTDLCYARWSPTPQELSGLDVQWAGAEKIFYRVTTWKPGAGGTDRIHVRTSTEPARGFWGPVPPPYIRDG